MMIGTFPFWLESLPELQILILRANGFHGPIWGLHTMLGFSMLRVSLTSLTTISLASYHWNTLKPGMQC